MIFVISIVSFLSAVAIAFLYESGDREEAMLGSVVHLHLAILFTDRTGQKMTLLERRPFYWE